MNQANMGIRNSNEALERLQKRRNQIGSSMLLMVLGAVFLVFPPIGLAIVFFGLYRISKIRKEMKGLYKDAFVREPLNNNFDNVVYEPERGYSQDAVRDFQVCKMGNAFYSRGSHRCKLSRDCF